MAKHSITRPRRGQRALQSAAKDLQYEWRMARVATNATIEGTLKQDAAMVNMALESFLIHARNIRDFFASRGNPDDVLARDFLGRPTRVRLSLLRSPKIRRRLNKRIAHISYSRARLGRGWNWSILLSEINDAMGKFEQRLRARSKKLADIVAAGAA